MTLLELDPLVPLSRLRELLIQLPQGYSFNESEVLEFLSRRRYPDDNRLINRTTFWRWRHDCKIEHQKVFSRLDVFKLCQICDHYRIHGRRREYLARISHN